MEAFLSMQFTSALLSERKLDLRKNAERMKAPEAEKCLEVDAALVSFNHMPVVSLYKQTVPICSLIKEVEEDANSCTIEVHPSLQPSQCCWANYVPP